MYSDAIKKNAFKLRKEGKSYREIKDITLVPKSTLSQWFGKELGMPFDRPALLKHLASIRPLASKRKTQIKLDTLEKIQQDMTKEVSNYPLSLVSFQKSLLAMLYWAEGAKSEKATNLKFVNTDPKLMSLFLCLLRNCYQIDEKKFRVYLHLHYYHPRRETRKFWSELLNIPESQFGPILIKKRSKVKRFRKNYMGICLLNYSGNLLRREIMAVGQAIQMQIEKHDIL